MTNQSKATSTPKVYLSYLWISQMKGHRTDSHQYATLKVGESGARVTRRS